MTIATEGIGCGKRRALGAFIVASALGLAFGGTLGCGDSTGSDVAAASPTASARSEDGEFAGEQDQVEEQWRAAFERAQGEWARLQGVITAYQAGLAALSAQNVKNPDDLTAHLAALDAAKAISAIDVTEMPSEADEISDQIKGLDEAAKAFGDAADELSVQLGALASVEVIDPTKGEFDVEDRDGYTYHVEYAMNARFEVDTTEGKPGQVALYLDLTGCSATVTNTTAGKKAPGILLDAAPLYAASLFPGTEGAFAAFGPLSSPMSGTSTRQEIYEAMTESYVSPFDNDHDLYSHFSFIGNVYDILITGGVFEQRYGGNNIEKGREFEVGESRELTFGFTSGASHTLAGSEYKRQMVGEINEGYAEVFEDVSGWAVTPLFSVYGDRSMSFAGVRNISSDLGNDVYLYSYDPVAN
ncbi:MAG: hypothetical protein LBG11_09305 [Bifidobacteriaceae bacterium]|jgi:hypothetical protein|nr:hypothetical protein [Bifidobacteriaceae bacterium]